MPRSTNEILQELAREQAKLAEFERAGGEVRAKIESLRSELAARPATTQLLSPLAVAAKCDVPNTPSGKVQLFRSLFRGRTDIFPTRFVSKKTGNPGYAPACSNKFEPGLCLLKSGGYPCTASTSACRTAGSESAAPWLTQLTQQGIGLLEPVYDAQLDSIRHSRVKAMDETPIKAGRTGHGKMRTGYFWPVYGGQDKVCFPFFASRHAEHVRALLGATHDADAVLLTDGYAAYDSYAKKIGITHARCWVHCRRKFFEAHADEPESVEEALTRIAALYQIEEHIREHKLAGEHKRLHRLTHSKRHVEAFFDWVARQFERQGLMPTRPFTQALEYARERRLGLEVFLTDPDVPLDTNHLERALRAIPMGRRSWNFCWTELGAKHVGIAQSLIVTSRLHGVDPYTYLVYVLQRVGQHPAARVAELTPRLWKQHFFDNPLRSDLCHVDRFKSQ
jgi:transposase